MKSEKILQEARHTAPGRIEVLLELAKVAALSGDQSRMREWLTYAKKLDPHNSKLIAWESHFEKEFASSTIESSRK